MLNKNVLIIGPLPPPLTGNSLALAVMIQALSNDFVFDIVNLTKPLQSGLFYNLKRIYSLTGSLRKIYTLKKSCDVIYFSVSESFLGNLKDIVVFILCFSRLGDMYIHLHGGAGMRLLLAKNNFISKVNFYFLKKMRGVIVLGPSFVDIYSTNISIKKIHVVPNFAVDELFIAKNNIFEKFVSNSILKLIYVSNFNRGKGYNEIVEAFGLLPDECKKKIEITFAGEFESIEQKEFFLNRISLHSNLKYIGSVFGVEKTELFFSSHIFVLPTYYEFEGQPISILEAYSSGCVVVTTNHSGIVDVFKNGVNGFEVTKKSSGSLKDSFCAIIESEPEKLLEIALNNYSVACDFYRVDKYSRNLKNILLK